MALSAKIVVVWGLFYLILTGVGCRQESKQPQGDPGLTRDTGKIVNQINAIENGNAAKKDFENLVADYESKDRGIWQKPNLVISLLGDLENKTVADVGAGTGYFTFRILPRAGKVIGIDIDQRFINFMDSMKVRMPERLGKKFEARLAKPDDPMLKPLEADAVIIVNTYGYIENRVQYLKTLSKGMTGGARLVIIDFKKNNLPIGPPPQYKVASDQLEKELISAGYQIEKIDLKLLDYQYIVTAKKPN